MSDKKKKPSKASSIEDDVMSEALGVIRKMPHTSLPLILEELGVDLMTIFTDVDLSGANFASASLSGADFSASDLSQVDFADAILEFAKFSRAKLSGANFCRADLTGANFEDSNLSFANFSAAKLQDANFRGADLTSASFKFADIEPAAIIGATLRGREITQKNFGTASAELGFPITRSDEKPDRVLSKKKGATRSNKNQAVLSAISTDVLEYLNDDFSDHFDSFRHFLNRHFLADCRVEGRMRSAKSLISKVRAKQEFSPGYTVSSVPDVFGFQLICRRRASVPAIFHRLIDLISLEERAASSDLSVAEIDIYSEERARGKSKFDEQLVRIARQSNFQPTVTVKQSGYEGVHLVLKLETLSGHKRRIIPIEVRIITEIEKLLGGLEHDVQYAFSGFEDPREGRTMHEYFQSAYQEVRIAFREAEQKAEALYQTLSSMRATEPTVVTSDLSLGDRSVGSSAKLQNAFGEEEFEYFSGLVSEIEEAFNSSSGQNPEIEIEKCHSAIRALSVLGEASAAQQSLKGDNAGERERAINAALGLGFLALGKLGRRSGSVDCTDHLKKAQQIFSYLLERTPNAEYAFRLAQVCFELGDFLQTERCLESAIELLNSSVGSDEIHIMSHRFLGLVYWSQAKKLKEVATLLGGSDRSEGTYENEITELLCKAIAVSESVLGNHVGDDKQKAEKHTALTANNIVCYYHWLFSLDPRAAERLGLSVGYVRTLLKFFDADTMSDLAHTSSVSRMDSAIRGKLLIQALEPSAKASSEVRSAISMALRLLQDQYQVDTKGVKSVSDLIQRLGNSNLNDLDQDTLDLIASSPLSPSKMLH